MAEEVLKYKVEIDSSDVAEQLTSIRNQVDLAMGSLAAQQVKPTTFQRISQVFETANVTNVADQFRQKFEKDTQQTIGGITQMLDRTATQMQLGYGRFTADARRLGLLAPTDYPSFEAPLPQMSTIPAMSTSQAMGAALLGTGFDPAGTATMHAFQGAAVEQLNRDFRSFMNNSAVETGGTVAGTLIGGAIGGFGGAVVGGLAGNLIGDVGQGALDLMAGQARAVNQMAGGLGEIATSQISGALSARAGRDFYQGQAQGLMDMTRSLEGRAMGLSLDEVQNQIGAFANAGGFRGMNMGDFSVALTQLPTAVRTVSQNLGIDQSASANLLADMQRLQLGGDNLLATSTAAVQIGSQANLLGTTASSMLGTAAQGIQMVAGTTMAPGDAANFAIQSRLLTSQAAAGGAPGMSGFINAQGGAENAAFAMMEQNLRYAMSPLGMARAANVAMGGSEMASVSEAMTGAASYFTEDPSRIFSSMVDQGAMVGGMHPLSISSAQVGDAVGLLRQMPQYAEGAIPANVVGGAMMSMDPSLSAQQAMAHVGQVGRGSQDYIMNQLISTRDTLIGTDRVNQVGPLRRFVTGVTQPFVNFADATVNKWGRGLQDMIDDFSTEVGDAFSEIISGEVTEKGRAILNNSIISEVKSMIRGESPIMNTLYENLGGLEMTEEKANLLLGETYENARVSQTSRFLQRMSAGSPGIQHLTHKNANFSQQGFEIFNAISYNASHEQKIKAASFIEREIKNGRIVAGKDAPPSHLTEEMMGDIMEFDKVISGFKTRQGTHDFAAMERISEQENMMLGTLHSDLDPIKLMQSDEFAGLSDMDAAELMWSKLGYTKEDGTTLGLHEASVEQRDAFLGIYSRAAAATGGWDDQASYLKQWGFTGSGIPTGKEGINRAQDEIIRTAVGTAITTYAETDDIRKNLIASAGKDLTPEERKMLAKAAGVDSLTEEQIAEIVLGESSGTMSLANIRENLLALGTNQGFTLSGKVMGMRRGLSAFNVEVNVGGETQTMKLTDAIRIKESLDIKDEVIKKTDEMVGLFNELSDVPLDDTVHETLQTIAINDIMTGKETTFSNKERMNKISFLSESKKKFDLSQDLEAALTADIVKGSNELAAAIDFSSEFMAMDDSIRKAGNEMAALEHHLQGAAASKLLIKSIVEDANGATSLKVTAV